MMRSACREYTLWYGKVTLSEPTFFISLLLTYVLST